MKYNTVNTYYPGTEKAGGGISGVPEWRESTVDQKGATFPPTTSVQI